MEQSVLLTYLTYVHSIIGVAYISTYKMKGSKDLSIEQPIKGKSFINTYYFS